MTLDDIPQVSEIERESFPTMWPQTAYKRELQQNAMARYLIVGDGHIALTAAEPQRGRLFGRFRRAFGGEQEAQATTPAEHLVGFIGLWFMLEECHVVTIAVRAAHRRRGIGE